MEGAALFMAVNQTEFTHAEGEFTIAVEGVVVNQNGAGAVHGFDGIICFVDFGEVHSVFVVIPVTGLFPKAAV